MQSLVLPILHALCFEVIHANGLNILLYSQAIAPSHVNFMGSLADLLVDAGHRVHIFMPEMVPGIQTNGTIKAQHIIRQPSTFAESPFTKVAFFADPFSDEDTSVFAPEQVNIILNGYVLFCQDFITNERLLSELRSVSYDVAITEVYDYCPIGLFHMLDIRTTVLVSAVPMTDFLADVLGLPTPLAYTSNTLSAFVNAPKLTYMERIRNIFLYFVSRNVFTKTLLDGENEVFRKYVDKYFPDLEQLTRAVPVLFVNTHPLIDIPRPISANVFYIGGVAMRQRKPLSENEVFRKYVDKYFPDLEQLTRAVPVLFVNTHPLIDIPRPISANVFYIGGVAMRQRKPLSEEFEKLTQSSSKGVVLFSLGSFTNTATMPAAMKKGILDAFHEFPDYTFIMKISLSDEDKALFAGYRNVHTFSWIDQINLLRHPSVVAFITHAGQNSVMESMFAGKPMICIPLFGDQEYNTATVLNKGVGVYVNRKNVNEKTLGNALEKILHDTRFTKAARRLKSKLEQYPWDPHGNFVRWIEYVAKFPEADIVLEGATIGFFKYFLLDILIPAFLILVVSIFVIIRLAHLLLRKLRRLLKTKVE
uniref:glucuronosyltransferase n=1 Tax=Ascaris lumbricoides TaxID=6252 RepID=A0A9J2Q502_ASCLU